MSDFHPDRTRASRGIVRGQVVEEAVQRQAKAFRRRMTRAEYVLWQHLRQARLRGIHFRRQQPIGGFIADFYCDAAGLVVEVDGPVHEILRARDAERDLVLAGRQLRTLRIRNDDVFTDLEGVLDRIWQACQAIEPEN